MFVCLFESDLQDLARTRCCCKSSAGWRPGATLFCETEKQPTPLLLTLSCIPCPSKTSKLQTPRNICETLRTRTRCNAERNLSHIKTSCNLIRGLKSSVFGNFGNWKFFWRFFFVGKPKQIAQVSDETRTLGLVVARGTSEDSSALTAWHLFFQRKNSRKKLQV